MTANRNAIRGPKGNDIMLPKKKTNLQMLHELFIIYFHAAVANYIVVTLVTQAP